MCNGVKKKGGLAKGQKVKTVALCKDDYSRIINVINTGYEYNGVTHKPNKRVAMACMTESLLGIRISDVLKLTLNDIVWDRDRYRLDIVEQKTGKKREFTVPTAIYELLKNYVDDNKINHAARIYPVCKRTVQTAIEDAREYLTLDNIGTHSFRKYFAMQKYEQSDHDIELVRRLMQHSSIAITQHYLGVSSDEIEKALQSSINDIIAL